ncbi:sigma-70 family RNA polymerase sigma factor [Pedobacter sp.]|uniref:sigma-70 family RNA polymerase sigma factor n=1 Tax=Pedobacter sp. TaxID=1411316 RepID=UPI002D1FA68A|nr:sigma-70 family RNA polymerase sigma factor [Pedobacter sp.]
MMDQMLELKWWEAVRQQDDRKLFDRLYLMHWEKLYAIAWNRTKDEAVAKDIVQDIFVSFWERRKDIIIRTGVSQYLTGALKNRLIDYFQSEQVKQRVFTHVLGQIDIFFQQPNGVLSYQEVEDILEDELEKMPDNMRKSFLLKLDNLSTPDIAKSLNLAEQTVSNLLTEASKRLRKNLPHRFHDGAIPILIALLQIVHDLLTNK